MTTPQPLANKLASKIDKSGDCWVWLGTRTTSGYGRVYHSGSIKPAHRVVYEALVGDIPSELEIDHLCENKSCVNPDHLEPVTHRENVLRAMRKKRTMHCKNGHEFSGDNLIENTGFWGGYQRQCRTCKNKINREYAKRMYYKSKLDKAVK